MTFTADVLLSEDIAVDLVTVDPELVILHGLPAAIGLKHGPNEKWKVGVRKGKANFTSLDKKPLPVKL